MENKKINYTAYAPVIETTSAASRASVDCESIIVRGNLSDYTRNHTFCMDGGNRYFTPEPVGGANGQS
jgi:hypothetical protein